jgi:hypothetical protein
MYASMYMEDILDQQTVPKYKKSKMVDSLLRTENIFILPAPLPEKFLVDLHRILDADFLLKSNITEWLAPDLDYEGRITVLFEFYDLRHNVLLWKSESGTTTWVYDNRDDEGLSFSMIPSADHGLKKLIDKEIKHNMIPLLTSNN